ncbi:MAG: GNAT family N-acetyltransferase [Crocinitomicaceae bacterium]
MESNKFIQIRIIAKEDIMDIFPLTMLLNENEDPIVIRERVAELSKQKNYFCVGAYDKDQIIACCGVWKLIKVYAGHHLEVDNVVVSPEYRSQNIGEKMIDFVKDFMTKEGFNQIELNAYIVNESGIRFWERQGFVKKGYHMIHFGIKKGQ